MASYWCHRCHRMFRVPSVHNIVCPCCDDGFVEAVTFRPPPGLRRRRNSVIVLLGERFHLYYGNDDGSDVQSLPGFRFDRLYEQVETNQIPAASSKAAIESLPIVKIGEEHISSESCCAVCKDDFEMGSSVREMPCKHIFHSDCILPWLSRRNSCPLCRRELPAAEGEATGLTLWRLPRGGYAVRRSNGGRRAGGREIPVLYNEMDGGLSHDGGSPARRRAGSREGGFGVGRSVRNIFSTFCTSLWPSNTSIRSNGDSNSRRLNRPGSVLSRQRRINRDTFVRD